MKVLYTIFLVSLCSMMQLQGQQAKQASECKLSDFLDAPKIVPFEFGEAMTYTESWLSLYVTLREDIASKERKCAMALARDMRFLTSTDRPNKLKLPKQSGGMREILQQFANLWEVAVLIDGNTIFLVDEGDVSRFKHELAILPQAASVPSREK
jgi:hypothetical protein